MVAFDLLVRWSPAFLIIVYLVVGLLKGRTYLGATPSDNKLPYFKDLRDSLLTLSGLLVASLSVVVGTTLSSLNQTTDVVTYLSIALTASLLGAYTVQVFETRNLFYFLGEIAEYTAVLSLGLAFYLFFESKLDSTVIPVVFQLFLILFIAVTITNLAFYIMSWRKSGQACPQTTAQSTSKGQGGSGAAIAQTWFNRETSVLIAEPRTSGLIFRASF